MYKVWSVLKYPATPVTAPEEATTVVTREFSLPPNDRRNLRIDVVLASATTTTAQTAKLQTANTLTIAGAWNWVDVKSATITTTASEVTHIIRVNGADPDDQDYLPLGQVARVVIVAGEDDTCVVNQVYATADC